MTLSFFIRLKFGWAHAPSLNIYKMTHKYIYIYIYNEKKYLFNYLFFKTNTHVCMSVYIYINAFEMLEVNMLIINRIKKTKKTKRLKKRKKKKKEEVYTYNHILYIGPALG